MRKEYLVLVDGKFELLLPDDEQIFAYVRRDDDSQMLVCANFTGESAECPVSGEWKGAQVLLHNYQGELSWGMDSEKIELKPYEAFLLYR